MSRNESHSHRARTLRRAALVLLTVGASVSTFVVVSGTGSAQAVGGFHTSASAVRVRSGASTAAQQINSVAAGGTAIDIACQVVGQTVTASGFGTSAIWDRLNGYGNGYISDLFVAETKYAALDPRIPNCSAPAPAPAPTSRESLSLAWARGQLGHSRDDWGRAISGWCARWSVGAYGRANSGYSTAYTMFQAFQGQGLVRGGTAPAGTFVFFAPSSVNGGAGHVAIADGAGGMITTTSTTIQQRPLSYAGAPYLGWSYAPAGWTR